jgi:hypothetical protein
MSEFMGSPWSMAPVAGAGFDTLLVRAHAEETGTCNRR